VTGITKGSRNYPDIGDWNAVCDRCGLTRKAKELRKEWDGLMVCEKCWEPRHPQELVRPVADPKPPPWTRPKPPPQKAQVGFGTGRSINGSSINYNSID
jgi:hypothetical protein